MTDFVLRFSDEFGGKKFAKYKFVEVRVFRYFIVVGDLGIFHFIEQLDSLAEITGVVQVWPLLLFDFHLTLKSSRLPNFINSRLVRVKIVEQLVDFDFDVFNCLLFIIFALS